MTHETLSYLKTHRKRSGLTQQEVAVLLGMNSSQLISRHESLVRLPNLQAVFAYQVLFGVQPDKMFPGTFRSVERQTLARIQRLAAFLDRQASTPLKDCKRCALQRAIDRAAPEGDHNGL